MPNPDVSKSLTRSEMPLLVEATRPASGDGPSLAEMLTPAWLRRAEREEAIACGRLVDVAKVGAIFADVLGREMRESVRRLLADHGMTSDVAMAIEAAPIEPVERPALRLVAG